MRTTPQAIAKKGEDIYRSKYQKEYEDKFLGKFLAIDIESEKAFLGESPEEAIEKAQEASPECLFHLVKIGAPGVYRVSYTLRSHGDWLFR